MLEQEIAALVRFIEPMGMRPYFGELPEGAATPSVYFIREFVFCLYKDF